MSLKKGNLPFGRFRSTVPGLVQVGNRSPIRNVRGSLPIRARPTLGEDLAARGLPPLGVLDRLLQLRAQPVDPRVRMLPPVTEGRRLKRTRQTLRLQQFEQPRPGRNQQAD